jgi:TPR repeat protein
MKKSLLILIVSLFFTSAAWAQQSQPTDVRDAAQHGDQEAQLEMGILYEYGFFMPGHTIPALAWYMLSAEQGNQKAIKRRDLLLSRMSQSEIDQAQSQSSQLVR